MRRFFALILSSVLLLSLCGCRKVSNDLSSGSFLSSEIVVSSDTEATESEESTPTDSSSQSSSASSNKTSTTSSQKTMAPPVLSVAPSQNKAPDIVDSSAPSVEIAPTVIEPSGAKPMAYTTLSENQKKIYSLMSAAIDSLNDQNIKITDSVGTLSDITVAYRAVTFDRPEVFWLSSTYSMASDGSFFRLNYTCTSAQKSSMLTTLKQMSNQIESAVRNMSSRYEKVHYLHDWLCNNVRYSSNPSDELAYSAFGAIVNGKAVCEGYSRAMQLFCDELGIPCYLVYGNSRGVPHMWNAVELESSWYHMDVTWDDDESNNFVRHLYLDITEQTILADHSISPLFSTTKQYSGTDSFNFFDKHCDGTKMNYFAQNNLYLTDDYAAVAAAIANSPSADKNYCELYIQNSALASDFAGNINSVLSQLNGHLESHGISINRYSVSSNTILIAWG